MSVQINGTNGLTFTDNSTQNTAATGFGFKNRIINGAMMIDQRNAGASVTPTTSTYIVDRWQFQCTQASKVNLSQTSGYVSQGFQKSLNASVVSTVTSPGATDYFAIRQGIEGFNVADLAWGTASAQPVTLSFWVQATTVGTYGGSFSNASVNRSYPFTYTINAPNTWEKKTVTVAGDTTGTWNVSNGVGINLFFSLCAGSTYSGTAGSWGGTFYASATGAVNLLSISGGGFYITGVQLEKGSTATSFDYRPYGTELALCQRYFSSSFPIGTAVGDNKNTAEYTGCMAYSVSNSITPAISYPVSMRTTPSFAFYYATGYGSTAGRWARYLSGTWTSGVTALSSANEHAFSVDLTGTFTNLGGYPAGGNWTASAEL